VGGKWGVISPFDVTCRGAKKPCVSLKVMGVGGGRADRRRRGGEKVRPWPVFKGLEHGAKKKRAGFKKRKKIPFRLCTEKQELLGKRSALGRQKSKRIPGARIFEGIENREAST